MEIGKHESIKNILLFILIFVIFYLMYKSKFTIKEKPQCVNENFTTGITLQNQVDVIFDKIYDLDVEATKNMGAICKTLLTGSGYYVSPEIIPPITSSTPNNVTIPARLVMEGDLVINGDLTISNTLIVNNGCIEVDNESENFFMQGMIVPFWGDRIPPGWAMCNGSDGTPDLRGRYIIGEGVSNIVNSNSDGTIPYTDTTAPGVDNVEQTNKRSDWRRTQTGWENYTEDRTILGGDVSVPLYQNQIPFHTHRCMETGIWKPNILNSIEVYYRTSGRLPPPHYNNNNNTAKYFYYSATQYMAPYQKMIKTPVPDKPNFYAITCDPDNPSDQSPGFDREYNPCGKFILREPKRYGDTKISPTYFAAVNTYGSFGHTNENNGNHHYNIPPTCVVYYIIKL